jgi:hypothetical protein
MVLQELLVEVEQKALLEVQALQAHQVEMVHKVQVDHKVLKVQQAPQVQ